MISLFFSSFFSSGDSNSKLVEEKATEMGNAQVVEQTPTEAIPGVDGHSYLQEYQQSLHPGTQVEEEEITVESLWNNDPHKEQTQQQNSPTSKRNHRRRRPSCIKFHDSVTVRCVESSSDLAVDVHDLFYSNQDIHDFVLDRQQEKELEAERQRQVELQQKRELKRQQRQDRKQRVAQRRASRTFSSESSDHSNPQRCWSSSSSSSDDESICPVSPPSFPKDVSRLVISASS